MSAINTVLYEKLTRLQWLMHKHQLHTHAESGPMADPTRGQGRILAMLKMQDGISTKDLSYLLGIRISSLNELLAKMEKGGYIRREPSETDKRVMLVKLTEKGKTEQQERFNPNDIFSCLSEEEQQAFADYLDRVITALEAEVGEEACEDERERWMRRARERMGDEMFERFASMKRDGFSFFGGFCGQPGQRHGHPHGHPGTPPPPPKDPKEE